MMRCDHKSDFALRCSLLLFGCLFVPFAVRSHDVFAGDDVAANKYLGAQQCKRCHDKEVSGKQYSVWKEMKHAEAYDTLSSEKAAEIAEARGIADPRHSDRCLRCHVTAFGEPRERVSRKLENKRGVQCDSCHGPGYRHYKARLAAAAEEDEAEEGFEDEEEEDAYVPVPEGEIVAKPDEQTCRKCHNDDSPTFQEFHFEERVQKIRHPDPRKAH